VTDVTDNAPDDSPEPRPVTILSGSLGAGKTTTLNHLLTTSDQDIAVLVNDMGSLNVDAELVEVETSLAGGESRMAELSNGCICCGLQGELRNELFQLGHSYDFDHLMIEASGISEPKPIAGQLVSGGPVGDLYTLETIATVVDTPRFAATFEGEKATREAPNSEGHKPLSDLAIAQVEFCTTILANKQDQVDDETAERVDRLLKLIQPEATIHRTTAGEVEPDRLLGSGGFDPKAVSTSAGWKQALDAADSEGESHDDHGHAHDDHGHAHDDHGHNHTHPPELYGVESTTYNRRRPFHPERLAAWLASAPETLVRAKGLVWIAGRDSQAYTLSLVGRQSQTEVNGQWIASLPAEHREKYKKAQSDLDWHDEHGDREQRLALLGTELYEKSLADGLDDCLVTDSEWAGEFEDVDNPFPELDGRVFKTGPETPDPYR
jgi:G3E family GTPase